MSDSEGTGMVDHPGERKAEELQQDKELRMPTSTESVLAMGEDGENVMGGNVGATDTLRALGMLTGSNKDALGPEPVGVGAPPAPGPPDSDKDSDKESDRESVRSDSSRSTVFDGAAAADQEAPPPQARAPPPPAYNAVVSAGGASVPPPAPIQPGDAGDTGSAPEGHEEQDRPSHAESEPPAYDQELLDELDDFLDAPSDSDEPKQEAPSEQGDDDELETEQDHDVAAVAPEHGSVAGAAVEAETGSSEAAKPAAVRQDVAAGEEGSGSAESDDEQRDDAVVAETEVQDGKNETTPAVAAKREQDAEADDAALDAIGGEADNAALDSVGGEADDAALDSVGGEADDAALDAIGGEADNAALDTNGGEADDAALDTNGGEADDAALDTIGGEADDAALDTNGGETDDAALDSVGGEADDAVLDTNGGEADAASVTNKVEGMQDSGTSAIEQATANDEGRVDPLDGKKETQGDEAGFEDARTDVEHSQDDAEESQVVDLEPTQTQDGQTTEHEAESEDGARIKNDPLKEFAAWLELIGERFSAAATKGREAWADPSLATTKTPLECSSSFVENLPEFEALVRPVFGANMDSEAKLQHMRRRAEDVALATEQRKAFLLESHQSQSLGDKVAAYLLSLRTLQAVLPPSSQQGVAKAEHEALADGIALQLAHAVHSARSWDPLLVLLGCDSEQGVGGRRDPGARADESFSFVLARQVKNRDSVNGELVRQFLNVALRGLPASPALSTLVKKIPEQDAALSYTPYPQCAFPLGRACSQFRRVFLALHNELFRGSGGGSGAREMLAVAVEDLNQFMSSVTRCALWKFPQLLECKVRDVAGDTSRGRVQDSRRGAAIPRGSTCGPMLVVRTCVEDAVLDPLMDNLFLAYNAVYGEEDLRLSKLCASMSSLLSPGELLTLCGVGPFFQLGAANPRVQHSSGEVGAEGSRGQGAESAAAAAEVPYQEAIDMLVDVWVAARTPAGKVCLLSRAHQACVDCAIKHYSRSTYQVGPNGERTVRPAVTDKKKLVQRRREMVGIFTYCVIRSVPPNLESQIRIVFDLCSRYAAANSPVSLHALALLFMSAKRVEQVGAAAREAKAGDSGQ